MNIMSWPIRFLSALLIGAATTAVLLPSSARAAKDELVIGITQFPSSFHPLIDAMMAKTYVLAMTRRPFTAFDANWKLVCLLCTNLPTIENGLAVPEMTPEGKHGIAVTYTIHPDARWGDGKPVTTDDVRFTLDVGRHPQTGVSAIESFRSIYKLDAINERTFTFHVDKLDFDYTPISQINPIFHARTV
jgi:peptide/nickel transport system substrate-binding protein